MLKKISIIAFFIISFALNAKILMQPYLQAVSMNDIFVMVETDSKQNVEITYWDNENQQMTKTSRFYLQTTAINPITYVHRINLDNLKPETKYSYKAKQEDSESKIYQFNSACINGASYLVGVAGDNRSNPKIFGKVAGKLLSKNPSFCLFNGDLCGDSSYYRWKSEFFIPSLLNLASTTPFFNAVGNHEGWVQNTKAFTQAPASKSENQEYYSFEYGDALYVILSTEHVIRKGSDQYNFLENILKTNKKTWKFIVFHKSAYVGGGDGVYRPMQKVATELFKKYNVTMAISGHSHFYQHNVVDGINHLTMGGAGAPLYDFKTESYTVKSVKAYHYGILEVTPIKVKMTVYDLEDKVLDIIEVTK